MKTPLSVHFIMTKSNRPLYFLKVPSKLVLQRLKTRLQIKLCILQTAERPAPNRDNKRLLP